MKYKLINQNHNSILNLFFTVIVFIIPNHVVKAGVHQKRLLEHLFKNYDPMERPVRNENESLNVSINLSVQQIVDVDEKKQTIIFSGWLDMSWTDYNLKWDPEEFGNITKIRVSSTKVWVPDLLLYNSADDSFDTTAKVNAILDSTGDVSYLPPGMFKSTCVIKVDDFPFDEQICSLKFGSWTHDEAALNLTNKSDRAQMDSYIKNGEWFLEDIISYSKSISYECCPEKFPFVMFEIHLRRRTLYFLFNLIFPCVLISFMSLLGFSLPPDSGEKIGLEVTVLLSIIMFSQIITGIIPESSLSIPKIAIYFASVMVISALSIISNIFVLIFHHRNVKIQQPMPKWMEILICGYLARLLRMKLPAKDLNKSKSKKNSNLLSQGNSLNDINELSSKSLLANVLDINDNFGVITKNPHFNRINKSKSKILNDQLTNYSQQNNHHQNYVNVPSCLKRENSSLSQSTFDNNLNSNDGFLGNANKTDVTSLKRNLNLILKELRVITNKIKDDEEDEEKALTWKFAAMVIDRLCMIFFAMATFLSTALILLTSKNFFKPSDPSDIF